MVRNLFDQKQDWPSDHFCIILKLEIHYRHFTDDSLKCMCFKQNVFKLHCSLILGVQSTMCLHLLRQLFTNHRTGYLSNLACEWQSIIWVYSQKGTGNGPSFAEVNTTTTATENNHHPPPLKKRWQQNKKNNKSCSTVYSCKHMCLIVTIIGLIWRFMQDNMYIKDKMIRQSTTNKTTKRKMTVADRR